MPPTKVTSIEVSTQPHSANISWAAVRITFDRETYWVQYGTDMTMWYASEVVLGNENRSATNEHFSVHISPLSPFTKYYFIIWAKNSVGNTSTTMMNFSTDQTGITRVAIKTYLSYILYDSP